MARISARAEPRREQVLRTVRRRCPGCGRRMWNDYDNRRTVVRLSGAMRLRLKVRRCPDPGRSRHGVPYRPEAEGAIALPQHEFGLDVIALVGALRYREHRSVPEIHRGLQERGVAIAERTVTNLLDRYDELLATALADDRRLRTVLARQGRVILALDGLQPDVGHEVLWVVRDCLSGEVLLARSLLSASAGDLAGLLQSVAQHLDVPVAGVVSDGQHAIRLAVASDDHAGLRAARRAVLPGATWQRCQFHTIRTQSTMGRIGRSAPARRWAAQRDDMAGHAARPAVLATSRRSPSEDLAQTNGLKRISPEVIDTARECLVIGSN